MQFVSSNIIKDYLSTGVTSNRQKAFEYYCSEMTGYVKPQHWNSVKLQKSVGSRNVSHKCLTAAVPMSKIACNCLSISRIDGVFSYTG